MASLLIDAVSFFQYHEWNINPVPLSAQYYIRYNTNDALLTLTSMISYPLSLRSGMVHTTTTVRSGKQRQQPPIEAQDTVILLPPGWLCSHAHHLLRIYDDQTHWLESTTRFFAEERTPLLAGTMGPSYLESWTATLSFDGEELTLAFRKGSPHLPILLIPYIAS